MMNVEWKIEDNREKYFIKDFYFQALFGPLANDKELSFWEKAGLTLVIDDLQRFPVMLIKEPLMVTAKRDGEISKRLKRMLPEAGNDPEAKQKVYDEVDRFKFKLVPPEGELIRKYLTKENYELELSTLAFTLWKEHVDRLKSKEPLWEDIDPKNIKIWEDLKEKYIEYRRVLYKELKMHPHHPDTRTTYMQSTMYYLFGRFDSFGAPWSEYMYFRISDEEYHKRNQLNLDEMGMKRVEENGTVYWEAHNVLPEMIQEELSIRYASYKIAERQETFRIDEFICPELLAQNPLFRKRHMNCKKGFAGKLKNGFVNALDPENIEFECYGFEVGNQFWSHKQVEIDYKDPKKSHYDYNNIQFVEEKAAQIRLNCPNFMKDVDLLVNHPTIARLKSWRRQHNAVFLTIVGFLFILYMY